jgi:hypothetical protein
VDLGAKDDGELVINILSKKWAVGPFFALSFKI